MNLKFVCSEKLAPAEEIAKGIRYYLPNLIQDIEMVRTEAFVGTFQVWDVHSRIERIVKPNWEGDIVLVLIYGSLYFADLELFGVAASTLGLLRLGSTTRPTSESAEIGGIFLPRNMFKELKRDVGYWIKLGIDEVLHYFGVPEQHDENCFFHAKAYGQDTVEDGRKDFCPKCRELMLQLEDPLDFDEIFAKVEDIYELKPKRRKEGALRRFLDRIKGGIG